MGKRAYHEELLHWIWRNRQLTGALQTVAGETLIIHHPGTPNPSDGPDFTNAKIAIGDLMWYGDVEIHWEAGDWFRHGHDGDSNYEGVVLHVVFDEIHRKKLKPVLPTLCMKPFLTEPLDAFFEGFKAEKGLPCSHKLSFISPAAFEAQIAKAHKQYFEQKADDLLHFYDPELPPSEAWQKLLIIALFDGLGVANNRGPMRKLACILFNNYSKTASLSALKKAALEEAFIANKYQWKRKGSRPSNHPEPRIEQGCELFWHIANVPFKNWFDTDIKRSFEKCIESVHCKPKVGKERGGVLYGIIWLPAVYLLGDLFGSAKLADAARQAWVEHRASLPGSVVRPFRQTNVPDFIYRKKLGTVHQLKSYCRARQCHRCEVFKSAITA